MSHREVLLAEDSEIDVELMRRAFRDANVGHTLRVVSDGQAAIDFLSRCGELRPDVAPALVLLDLKMPRRDGLQVLQWIKTNEDLRNIPVAILSSSGLSRDVEPAYASGANVYFVKPASIKDRAEIVRFVADWIRLAEPPLAVTGGIAIAATFRRSWLRGVPHQASDGGS